MSKTYDLVIIGAGPAGLSAASYTSRAGFKTLILEQALYGGQINNTAEIENFPGFPTISGADLAEQIYQSTIQFGADYAIEIVEKIELIGDVKHITTNQNQYDAKVVIIATGAQYKKLNVIGEDEYNGRGVSYCAVCDGNFFKDKNIAIVGGGNAALKESLYLANIVKKVTIIHRGSQFSADQNFYQRALNHPKIDFLFNQEIVSINGDSNKISDLTLVNNQTNNQSQLAVEGLFIYIGLLANTKVFENLNILNDNGWVVTNQKTETAIAGIYAIGDVRADSTGQITTAVGDGTMAGQQSFEYLQKLNDRKAIGEK